MSEPAKVQVRIINSTGAAYLVTTNELNRIWIPKSVVESEEEAHGGTYTFWISEWFALKEGLI